MPNLPRTRLLAAGVVASLLSGFITAVKASPPSPVSSTQLPDRALFQRDCLATWWLAGTRTCRPVPFFRLLFVRTQRQPARTPRRSGHIAPIVFGTGRQGLAAAYDLLKYGGADRLTLVDSNQAAIANAIRLLRRLLDLPDDEKLLQGIVMAISPEDPTLFGTLSELIARHDVVLSCLPYFLNPLIARAAIVGAGVPYADLGGHLDTTQQMERELGKVARAAGLTLVTDLGVAPGLSEELLVAAMSELHIVESGLVLCGGLPQDPLITPLGYQIAFSLRGLIGNLVDRGLIRREGTIVPGRPLSERELLDWPGLGIRLEAAITQGGLSTGPERWGRDKYGPLGTKTISSIVYKTLRYPGHFDLIQWLWDADYFDTTLIKFDFHEVSAYDMTLHLFQRAGIALDRLNQAHRELLNYLGLMNTQPLSFDGLPISPREMFARASDGKLNKGAPDRVFLRATARGKQADGQDRVITYEMLHRANPRTGFSAMQETTGFTAAIVTAELAHGRARKPGFASIEETVAPSRIVEELRKRGVDVAVSRQAPSSKITTARELGALWAPDSQGNYSELKLGNGGTAWHGLRIVALESFPGEATLYQGNLIESLRLTGNSVDVMPIDRLEDAMRLGALAEIDPHIVMAPQGDAKAAGLIRQLTRRRARNTYGLFYPTQRTNVRERTNTYFRSEHNGPPPFVELTPLHQDLAKEKGAKISGSFVEISTRRVDRFIQKSWRERMEILFHRFLYPRVLLARPERDFLAQAA